MLKWIVERLEGKAEARDTPIGRLPTKASLDVKGLGLTADDLELLLSVDPEVWMEEAALIPADYKKFGDKLPAALWAQHKALLQRLAKAAAVAPKDRASDAVRVAQSA